MTGLALIFHELATNAAKSGALSTTRGVLHVDGEARDGIVTMTWQEQDGPLLAGAPAVEGFGTVLVRGTVTQFKGEISHEWEPSGVTIRLLLPVEHLGK